MAHSWSGLFKAPSAYDPNTAHVFCFDVMRIGAAGTYSRLVQGTRDPAGDFETPPSPGRVLTILGPSSEPAGAMLTSGGNIVFASGTTSWTGAPGAIIQLVYDGVNWREITRSAP